MTQEGMVVATLVASAGARAQAPEVRLHAAGNLHAAMLELARSYRAAGGAEVTATFGASGPLRECGSARDVEWLHSLTPRAA